MREARSRSFIQAMGWVVLRGSCSRSATAYAAVKCRMARSGRIAVILDPSCLTGGTGMLDLPKISPPQMTCQDPQHSQIAPKKAREVRPPAPNHRRWALPVSLFLVELICGPRPLATGSACRDRVGAQGLKSFCPFKKLIGGPLMGLLDGSSHSASLRRPVPALSPRDRGGNGQGLKLAVVSERRPD